MSQRIRELEDALALLQSQISKETHPLLREELLYVKDLPEKRPSAEPDAPEDPLAGDPVDAFGTLTIDDSGESIYFGATAGSEAIAKPEIPTVTAHTMPVLLNSLAAMFPVGSQCPVGHETFGKAMDMLLSYLPSRSLALSLCETFVAQASWLLQPVKQDELIQDILTPIYIAKEERENAQSAFALHLSPHKLSTIFSVFALAILGDLTLPAFNEEGDRYHHCARAALALRSVFDSPKLDRKIRDSPLPPMMMNENNINGIMRDGYVSIARAIVLLFLHKNYFARALIDYPADPLRSPYATSFSVAARCSSAVIQSSSGHIRRFPELCMRSFTLWSTLFSAAMVSGLIVTRAPSSSMAPAAFSDLVLAVELFESLAKLSERVRTGMDILHKLQEKASSLLKQHHGSGPTSHISQRQNLDADDLAIYSGQIVGDIIPQRTSLARDQSVTGTSMSPGPSVTPATLTTSEGQSSAILSPFSAHNDPGPMPEICPSILPSGVVTPRLPPFDSPFQIGTSEVSTCTSSEMQAPGFSSLHSHMDYSSEENHHPAQVPSNEFTFDLSMDSFQQLYTETLGSSSGANDGNEPGTSLSNDMGVDMDWALFMKESGLI
ncbi:hypothetical protein HWV62_43752 [Athelia sp. TMB]|nr:hypothetical protein HWV62_9237 [Athelia sp. TMB]KAF7985879.1 hypothetical protein HWV62_43752 [Athelia sp. TMB]